MNLRLMLGSVLAIALIRPARADQTVSELGVDEALPAIDDTPPAKTLDATLAAIAARHGERTADFVAMQLEYPRE